MVANQNSSKNRRQLPPRDPKGGRPTQEIAARLGEHILEIALEQFIALGVEGASMDGIAAAANVSKRTLYARHASKAGLLVAAVEHGSKSLLRKIVADIPRGNARERVLKVSRKMLDVALDPEVIGLEPLVNWIVSRELNGDGPEHAIGAQAGVAGIQCVLEEAEDTKGAIEDVEFLAAFLFDALVTAPRTRILVRRDLENSSKAKTAYLERTLDLIARAIPFLSR